MSKRAAKESDLQYSEQESARRRDAVIKHMLNTPPKPHSEMKLGKRTGKAGKSPKVRKAVEKRGQ
jgi:hypothetical protein